MSSFDELALLFRQPLSQNATISPSTASTLAQRWPPHSPITPYVLSVPRASLHGAPKSPPARNTLRHTRLPTHAPSGHRRAEAPPVRHTEAHAPMPTAPATHPGTARRRCGTRPYGAVGPAPALRARRHSRAARAPRGAVSAPGPAVAGTRGDAGRGRPCMARWRWRVHARAR